ncbi:YihY/virulence factor BrkB family protein [Brevundimonas sp. 2R-24]|uniref:YihY/virulence factor BrkB family protein n=1 Tax=Peiella sedimenti TaxID=3061083 RepID=A0ABT8SKY9_9CAUL|nr:YihY/virulence factor BrkB family protein [Caulobacteraceae bacterium XZ-24]
MTRSELKARAKPAFGVLGRALGRLWGRDVMLYTGGVCFFALLAVFPAISLLIGFYKVVLTTGQATAQAAALGDVIPHAARGIFENEVVRLTDASARTVTAQSALALIIGAYAAHRGFKALLAGLTFIHDEPEPLGFLKFNLLAFVVALAAFALFTVVSGAVLTSRILEETSPIHPFQSVGLDLEWLWASVGLAFGLSALYRYAMSHSGPVIWLAAVGGGVAASLLFVGASWACAFYVEQIVELGATYGSVGAVVVFLIWLSWNVNAVFFGGALATEIEIALDKYRGAQAVTDPG